MKKLLLTCILLLPVVANATTITGTYDTDVSSGSQTTGTGPYTLTSTDTTYSLLTFNPSTNFKFSDITNLNVDYDAGLGGIGGGSPRLEVDFTDNSYLQINFGPAGSFVDTTLGAGNSGNLVAMTDLGRYDNSGTGGSFYSNLTTALSLAGNKNVDSLTLILDSFGGNDRSFTVSAINVDVTGTPEPGTILLMAAGLLGAGIFSRRRLRATN